MQALFMVPELIKLLSYIDLPRLGLVTRFSLATNMKVIICATNSPVMIALRPVCSLWWNQQTYTICDFPFLFEKKTHNEVVYRVSSLCSPFIMAYTYMYVCIYIDCLTITFLSPNRFQFLHRARQWYCHFLSKISKSFGDWNGCYWRYLPSNF